MWLACINKDYYPEVVECLTKEEAHKVCQEWLKVYSNYGKRAAYKVYISEVSYSRHLLDAPE